VALSKDLAMFAAIRRALSWLGSFAAERPTQKESDA
jgi:hypothetical protein